MRLAEWLTKIGKIPKFRHHPYYDNAPSHHKRAPNALNVDAIAKNNGHGKARIRDTTWDDQVQSMIVLDEAGNVTNKGLQTIGFERGHWDKDGKVLGKLKSLTLEEMRDVLRGDPDFAYCPTILEEAVADFVCEFCGGFSMSYLAKFWCSLAWIEQYWNDVKEDTRQKCDYTMPNLKKTFPAALATACPPHRIRNYMQRSLDHVTALGELGRHGDFAKIPGLRKKYKSHRRSELIRVGQASETKARSRSSWGAVAHARVIEAAVPSGAAGAAAMDVEVAATDTDGLDEDEDEDAVFSDRTRAEAIVEVAALLAEDAAEAIAEGRQSSLRPRNPRPAGFYFALSTGGSTGIPEP